MLLGQFLLVIRLALAVENITIFKYDFKIVLEILSSYLLLISCLALAVRTNIFVCIIKNLVGKVIYSACYCMFLQICLNFHTRGENEGIMKLQSGLNFSHLHTQSELAAKSLGWTVLFLKSVFVPVEAAVLPDKDVTHHTAIFHVYLV